MYGASDGVARVHRAERLMARIRRSGGGGRVTPKGTQPRHRARRPALDSERQAELRAALDSATQGKLRGLDADLRKCIEECDGGGHDWPEEALSSTISTFIISSWNRDGVSSRIALSHAMSTGGPVGAVIAAGLAAYGESAIREHARRALRRFVNAGVAVPDWAALLGVAEPVRAVKIRYESDEHWTLVIDYARPDGSMHGLWVCVRPFYFGITHDFELLPLTAPDVSSVVEGRTVEDVSLAEARAILDNGLERFDEMLRDADWFVADEFGSDADLRALVGQRVGLLPTGGKFGTLANARAAHNADGAPEATAELVAQTFP